ncbi:MAG: hypothetical protein JST89_18970 [Cyanobacteria bacterium SZAS-4]|nr:hypothetical protein [Cyanobacteria bacterium SZAS-4]
MNIKALTLSIISVAAAVAASSPAQAQEGPQAGGARWHFAPNYFKLEQPNLPRGYNAPTPSAVRSGSVPKASSLLGDPAYLAKAPAPMPAPLVRVNQAVSAVPIAVKPASPLEAFQKAFGKPVSAAPVMVAAAPQGMSAMPASTLPSANKSVAGHIRPRSNATTGLHGVLKTPQHRPGLAARPAAPISSYGSSFFSPVPFNPASAGSGSSTSATVSGRIYHGR